ncbi:hypothetical protein Xoosp13_110 [Xanthomonas phage Xoo-sp13]|nr:hypothetical protein Xoosp13_110 [Xanthomonas phage Xoo-sp13]
MPRKNSKTKQPKPFIENWSVAIQHLHGPHDAEELIPTVDDSPVDPMPPEPQAEELPAVFTEAQEERIRAIIREEITEKLSISDSSFSGYYGENGVNLSLNYGESYRYGEYQTLSSISINIPKG